MKILTDPESLDKELLIQAKEEMVSSLNQFINNELKIVDEDDISSN